MEELIESAERVEKDVSLAPAYDICPQGCTGNEASQAMLISGSF